VVVVVDVDYNSHGFVECPITTTVSNYLASE
jgi:hypothetical protein